MIGLVVDTGSNVPDLILQQYQIRKVPLRILLGKIEYRDDGIEVTEDQLLNYMQTSIPKTSLPFYEDIANCFEEMILDGYTEILAINIASALSGTFNSFNIVAKKVMKQHSNVKITVFDSRTVSIGIGLLVYKAAGMIAENPFLTTSELITMMNDIIDHKSRVFFVVPTLKYIIAGGRISRIVGTIGELFHVKPILTISREGMLDHSGKEMGLPRAIDKIIQNVKDFIGNQQVEGVAIYHSGKSEETLGYIKKIQDSLASYEIPKIFTGTISSTLLVHGGPGLVGVGVQIK
jgi:DegV family protein with EDD domain